MSKQCPHCKSRNPDEFEKCQWCGKRFDEPVGKQNISTEIENHTPFEKELKQKVLEEKEKIQFIEQRKTFFETLIEIIIKPVKFFRQISSIQDKEISLYFTGPLKFAFWYLVCEGIIFIPFLAYQVNEGYALQSKVESPGFWAIIRISIILGPIGILVLGSLILSLQTLIWHLSFKILKGKGQIQDTLKIVCYSFAPLVIGIIPHIRYVGWLWNFALIVIGAKELHKLTTSRTIYSIILSIVFLGIIIAFLSFLFFGVIVDLTPKN